jgi:nitroreductase
MDIEALGEDVPLLEGLRTTRSIRRLKPDPVPRALIRKVCEAGSFAPSGGNRQPWIFVAVVDVERRAWIAERYADAWNGYMANARRAMEADPDFPEAKKRNIRSAAHLAEHLHEVPVHLFIAGWKRGGRDQGQALFPCAQNVLLACRAVGLGASLTMLHRVRGEEIDRYLGLDPEKTPSIALIPIGWPIGRYGRPPRRPIEESLHFDRFERSEPSEE